MIKLKCEKCKKVLDPKKDLDEIEFQRDEDENIKETLEDGVGKIFWNVHKECGGKIVRIEE